MTYKIACVSDLHGHLPKIPECDLLLLGGDYCPTTTGQLFWFQNVFANWLQNITVPVIGVAGNHDELFEKSPHLIPKMNWTYLQDSGTKWNDFNIWGSPWQKRFFDWSFNADEEEMEKYWELIPDDTDILVLHGPPYGYGDFSTYGNEHCGSPSLLKKIESLPNLKLTIFGHIHSGYGKYMVNNTTLLNCSLVNEKYKVSNDIQVFEIGKK